MEAAYNKKDFYQSSMYYGTMLGIVWSIMYILFFTGISSMTGLLACFSLFVASPFIAMSFAKKYRKEECNDIMNFRKAWIFLFYMYVCAGMFSAFVSFIYLRFIDNGTFFMSMQEILKAGAELPGTDEAMKQQIQAALEALASITPGNFVWQLLSNNMFNTSVLPLIIALFVRKNNLNN